MSDWVHAADVSMLVEDDVTPIVVGGRDIAVYRISAEVYATENRCTHGLARLSDGFLDAYEIECPLHQGRFDVRCGKALCAPLTEDIRAYPVKVEDGRVYLQLPDGKAQE
jgi:naphthalene 1,2-dioxygenase system ferredoxin subunit